MGAQFAMKLARIGALLRKVADFITVFLVGYAFLCAFIMMFHIFADVVGRFLWVPLPGTLHIVSHWYMVGFIFLTIAYAERKKSHIEVTFVKERLPEGIRPYFDIFGLVLMFVIFFTFGWYTLPFALKALAIREYIEDVFLITIWPVAWYLPIGCWALCAQLLIHIGDSCASLIRRQSR